MRMISSLAAAASLIAAPAAAREWPAPSGWTVSEDGPVDCSLVRDQEEGRDFWILLRTSGDLVSGFSGVDPELEKDYRIAIDGRIRESTPERRAGDVEALLDELAAGRSLELHDKSGIVERIDTTGGAAAIAQLRLCSASLEARLAREIASGQIVLEPRATRLADFPKPAVPASASFAEHFTSEDFPSWELLVGAEGITAFRTEVRADGGVGSCAVTVSSGSEVLDIATCRIIQDRVRFDPARDDSGNAVADVFDGRVRWVHPDGGRKGVFLHAPPAPALARTIPETGPPGPAQLRQPLATLFSAHDYPAAAMRALKEGEVGFRLTVSPAGRVSDCVVTAPSGTEPLDQATCRILRSRARFTPARGEDGRVREGMFEGVVTWEIPPLPTPEGAKPLD